MAFVLDASMMLNWYFQDECRPADTLVRRVASEDVVVPAHWQAEVANGILIGERRGRSVPSHMPRIFDLLKVMRVTVDEEGGFHALDRILPLARAHRLTIYDAIYLELAERSGLALATLDRALAVAARSVGIEALGAEDEET